MKYTFTQLTILFAVLFASTVVVHIWLPDATELQSALLVGVGLSIGLFFKAPTQ